MVESPWITIASGYDNFAMHIIENIQYINAFSSLPVIMDVVPQGSILGSLSFLFSTSVPSLMPQTEMKRSF